MNTATAKPVPHFTPPRPEFFTAKPEDQKSLELLRLADRNLAHAEQELRGAMAMHEKARVAHIAAETAFANTEAGRAFHASYVDVVQQHTAARTEHEALLEAATATPAEPPAAAPTEPATSA